MAVIPSNIGERVDYGDLAAVVGSRSPVMERIAAAASARMLVCLQYDGEQGVSQRNVEPYAVRKAKNGRVYLLAVDHTRNHEVRNFRFDRIRDAEPVASAFTPRYEIEFIGQGGTVTTDAGHGTGGVVRTDVAGVTAPAIVHGRETVRPSAVSSGAGRDFHPRARNAVYIVVCPFCGRQFTDSVYRTALEAHKSESGARCEGRHGFPV